MTLPYLSWRVGLVAGICAAAFVVFGADNTMATIFLGTNLALLVLCIADYVLCTSPKVVDVEREMPTVLPLDQFGEIKWRVRNNGVRATTIAIADELFPTMRSRTRRVSGCLAAGSIATLSSPFRPSRRGVYEIKKLVVRTQGPLGLVGRQRKRECVGKLNVYPPFRSKKEAELRIEQARTADIGLRSARARGGGTEFEQLREYVQDDEYRRIDWAATARYGKPIVRDYRAERNQTLLCLLDSGRSMAGKAGDVPRIEHAMDAIMALVAVTSRLGDKAGLVTFDSKVRKIVPPAAGRAQLGRVTQSMFALEPTLVESDYELMIATTLGRFRRRAMMVLFTELSLNAATETLLPALSVLTRNHVVFIASVLDTEVARLSLIGNVLRPNCKPRELRSLMRVQAS